jgi:hypothetical protein
MSEVSYMKTHPLESNITLTQAAFTSLHKKYEYDFNFFMVKSINNIIYHKGNQLSRNYTDLLDYIEDVEYFKKYYHEKNKNGKEEIRDRMTLLKSNYRSR